MKANINHKMRLPQTGLIAASLLLFTACNTENQKLNNIEVAEEANDAKFETQNREKDAQFLVNAAEINLEQIHLGQLAQQTSTLVQVKESGKEMENNHRLVMNDLTLLAKKKGITLPTSQSDDRSDAFNKLSNKSGADFDKEYYQLMVSEHRDAIDLFEKASDDVTDTEIRNWARTSLPGLRAHLDNAIINQSKLKN